MPETNGISSGKNTEETYIIISNICLFGVCMRRIWGFALFFFGLGMLAMLLIGNTLIGCFISGICLLAGYYMFCC